MTAFAWHMTKRSHSWIVLLVVQALVFGWAALHTGFYHDDWTILEAVSKNGMNGVILAGWATRVANVIYWPALYRLFGMNPRGYQLFIFGLDIVMVVAFYELMLLWLESERQAFVAALFALLLPVHAASHHWFATSGQTIAVILAFLSFLAYEYGYQSSWVLFVVGLNFYESIAFLPAVLIASRWERGKSWRPALGMLLVALLVPALMHRGADGKPMKLSYEHFVTAYVEGLKCVTVDPIILGFKAWR